MNLLHLLTIFEVHHHELIEKVFPEFFLVMSIVFPEALFAVRLKTQISRYIKPLSETKCSSDALKNLLDRFQFPVTIVVDLINFVLILIPTP